MGTGLCFPRRPIPQLEGRIALALRRFAPGLYLACTRLAPPNPLPITWLAPGLYPALGRFGPAFILHTSSFILHFGMALASPISAFCFLLSVFPHCQIAALPGFMRVSSFEIGWWLLDVGCWMFDVRCSMFLLSLRSFSFQVSFRAATFNGRSMALARLEARLKGAVKDRERESHGGPAKAAHDEAGAELLLEGGLRASRLSEAALARLFRGAAPKVVLARWFRQRTAVPLRWVSGR